MREVPLWLAPNIITLVGFLFIVVPHLMILSTSGQSPPDWLFYTCGVCMLLYSLCDNTDGKQARRTGSSSSLGMMLDHGCDAVTCCLLTLSVGILIGVDKPLLACLLCANTFLYFLANLEQYFTHYLYLPRINAVSEGLWGIALLMLVSPALGGHAFWTSHLGPFKLNMFVVAIPIFTFMYNLQMHLGKILQKTNLATFLEATTFDAILALGVIIYFFTSTDPCFCVFYMQAFNVSKATILCQLAHFAPFRKVNIAQLVLLFGLPVFPGLASVLFVLSFLDFAVFSVVMVLKVAQLIGVKVFTINPPAK